MTPKHYAACSFGKDSIATILLALEHNEPLDAAVYTEVMFDTSRGISAESPEHSEWIKGYAIPRLEAMGCKVIVLHAKTDFYQNFHKIRNRGPRAGQKRGFLYGGGCELQRPCKQTPVAQFFRGQDFVQYIGIAEDEPDRLKALDGVHKISLLAKYHYTEAMAMELCKRYDLVSPIYKTTRRGGCWFCPNNTPEYFLWLRQTHPELWHELELLNAEENIGGKTFKYGATLQELSKRLDTLEQARKYVQLTLNFEE